MVDDVRSLKRVGVIVVIEMNEVVLFIEAHDDAVFQRCGIHQHLVFRDMLVLSDSLDEFHKQLELGYPVACLAILLGLHTRQHQQENDGAHPRVSPAGPYSIA